MAEKVTVLVLKDTGHVLAAATRTGNPEAPLEAAALAGEGLPVRSFEPWEVSFTVAADELEAKVVDLEDGLLADPRRFALGEGDKLEPQLDVELTPLDSGLTLSDSGFSLNLPDAYGGGKAWFQLEGPSGADPRVGNFDAVAGSNSHELSLASGEYRILIAVQGYEVVLLTSTVP